MKSIFIMSSERSGSNLVREMLDAHPAISAPPAAQLSRILTSYRVYYGDLSVDANMLRMITDAIAINNSHPERIDIQASESDVFSALEERSVWGVIAAMYSLHAQKRGKLAWASKDNFLFDFSYEIKYSLPDAYFIYLFRDGRDYACSMKKVGLSSRHIYHIAKQWQDEQQACLKSFYSFKGKQRAHLLRYEDLIAQPETELRKLCEFLNEPFSDAMLNFHASKSAKAMAFQSAFWENLSKPVIKDNFAKFKSELRKKEIDLFEAVAGTELQILGYPLINNDALIKKPSRLLVLWYGIVNSIAKYMRLRSLNKKEPWRKPRADVIQAVFSRLQADPVSTTVISPIEYYK